MQDHCNLDITKFPHLNFQDPIKQGWCNWILGESREIREEEAPQQLAGYWNVTVQSAEKSGKELTFIIALNSLL